LYEFYCLGGLGVEMAEPYRLASSGAGHARLANGFLSRYEQPLLFWLAERIPRSITPGHLTFFGVAAAGMTGIAFAMSGARPEMLWLALAGVAANWAGDSLDGTLARRRRIERPRFGFFIDHLSDLASLITIVIGLGMSPYLRFDVACLALIGYLVLMVFTLVKLYVLRTMQLTYFGVGPTEMRAVIAVGIVIALTQGPVKWPTQAGTMSLFDGAAIAILLFALGSAIVMFIRDGMILARLDPAPVSAADLVAHGAGASWSGLAPAVRTIAAPVPVPVMKAFGTGG
jgi:archaetidylinositol phosphate synthase